MRKKIELNRDEGNIYLKKNLFGYNKPLPTNPI